MSFSMESTKSGAVTSMNESSMEVTQWPLRLLLVAVMVLIILGVMLLMLRSWRKMRRGDRFGLVDLPAPMILAPQGFMPGEGIDALFLGTSVHGQWLSKVLIHDLGTRSRARVSWDPHGILFERSGASDVYIPRTSLVEVTLGSGVAGTVRAKDSVVIFVWDLGTHRLATGVRADTAQGHQQLIGLLESEMSAE
jgi:hypothetical protein